MLMDDNSRLCERCNKPVPPNERIAYRGRCEDCWAGQDWLRGVKSQTEPRSDERKLKATGLKG